MDSGLVEEVEERSPGMERKGRKKEETKPPHLPRQHMKTALCPHLLDWEAFNFIFWYHLLEQLAHSKHPLRSANACS